MNEAVNKVPESDIKSLSIIHSWVDPLYGAHTVLKLGPFSLTVSDVVISVARRM